MLLKGHDSLANARRPDYKIELELKVLRRVFTLTVLANRFFLHEPELVLQVHDHIFVDPGVFDHILIEPVDDVDLIDLEPDDLHENHLVDLRAARIPEAKQFFAESDLVLETLYDRLPNDKRQYVLQVLREDLAIVLPCFEDVSLEL